MNWFRRPATAVAATVGVLTIAGALLPAATTYAYNVGVKSMHVEPYPDVCPPDTVLPCTPGAGTGEANVLLVGQELVGGHPQYHSLAGTSLVDDALWLGVEFGAGCRTAHHLIGGWFTDDIGESPVDGAIGTFNDGGSPGSPFDWPLAVDVPDAKTMPSAPLALNVPLDVVFDENLLGGFLATEQAVFDVGEAHVEQLVGEGMSDAEARAVPFDYETAITVRASVRCQYGGAIAVIYERSHDVLLPLTIRYQPFTSRAPGADQPRPTDLQAAPAVTGLALSVVTDPDDACVLHLSATVQTNTPMTVDYRFVDPYGQASAVHSVDVDQTLTAFVSHPTDVPMAPEPDPIDDVLFPGQGPGKNYASGVDTSQYSGTYTVEVLSPHHRTAADGFTVPYCDHVIVRLNPAVGDLPGDVTAPPDPTHRRP